MPEFAWMYLYNRILNMTRLLNMSNFLIWQSSEYDGVLNTRLLHIVLNMPEYALTEFWMYHRF